MRSPLSMFAPSHVALPRRAASLRALLLAGLAVVIVHAVFLRHAHLVASSAEGCTRPSVTALHVRAPNPVAPAAPLAVAPAVTAVDTTPATVLPRAARETARETAPERRARAPAGVAPPGSPSMAAAGAELTPGPTPEPASVAAAAPDVARQAEPIPTYAATIPPPFTQVYELRRGALVGRAELHWRPAGEGYEARLSARLGDARWLEWISRGGFDAAGVAPLRFTDQRRGRAAQAANFRRSGGGEIATISYSGPAVRHELHAGAQDRLSWIVQLSSIAQGRGVALSSGASIVMFVTGARGDGDVWVFTVHGPEPIDSAGGKVDAIKLVREPRSPYDTLAEIWLDPARAHLPARLRLSTPARSDALEFVLQETAGARP